MYRNQQKYKIGSMIVTIGVLLAATVVFLIFNGPDLPEEITELYWVSDKKYMKKPQMLYNIQNVCQPGVNSIIAETKKKR